MSAMKRDSASASVAPSPMLFEMTLKKQLRLFLERHGMTAAQLARESGVAKQSISGWLAGNNPRDIRQLKKVADIFKTTVDCLMFGNGISNDELKDASIAALLGEEWVGGTFEIKIRRVPKS
jgi:transcriptional regulator with XRE-family HTH domain